MYNPVCDAFLYIFVCYSKQERIQGVCLAMMTGPFALQVLSIKADKISKDVTAGLQPIADAT